MKNLFIFFGSIMLLLACSKEKVVNPVDSDMVDTINLRTLNECNQNFEYNFQSSFLLLAENIYEEYPMQVFCTCDCNAYETLSSAFNDRLNFVPELFSFDEEREFNCYEGREIFGNVCDLNMNEKYLFNESLIDSIDLYASLNSQEKDFLIDLNNDVLSGNIDICRTIELSNSITFSSELNRKLVLSSVGFVDMVLNEHMMILNPDLTNDDNVEGLLGHGLAALGGAWFSAMKWTYENRDCVECGEGLLYEMGWGAAGGGLMAI